MDARMRRGGATGEGKAAKTFAAGARGVRGSLERAIGVFSHTAFTTATLNRREVLLLTG
jgi:hypothetical protein